MHAALDWAHADSILRRQPVDVLVVDPQFDTPAGPRADGIRNVRDRYRSLPMVVYADLTAQTMRPLVELGREGLRQVVLYGFDDDPQRLRSLLEQQPGIVLSEKLLDALKVPLGRLPERVAHAVERLVRNPSLCTDVSDLVSAAGIPRRSLYRRFEEAGLVSPRELIVAARVLRAYAFLREPASSLHVVASHVRFSDTDAMARAMKWGVGLTPGRARERLAPDDFVARLAARVGPSNAVAMDAWLAGADDGMRGSAA